MTRCSIIGFDSAWTDKASAPGAVCILRQDEAGSTSFREPVLASFAEALALIRAEQAESDVCIVALDQPTIVPNETGMRPVDRVAASTILWAGGGVQPANRSKIGMFDDAAPIWRFKRELNASDDPEQARSASTGTHLTEVFPALALLAIRESFHARLCAPRYNPARRKTFKLLDWHSVLDAVSSFAAAQGVDGVADWCSGHRQSAPRKADQDKMDGVICALIGLHWRRAERASSIMIGDLTNGYMIAPATAAMRARIEDSGRRYSVPIDGALML
ncbi:DUF429 domain-containing protein [Tianweitania sp. BSSL-BM11]|uniref:DUF429 domain-containing protein n=1 Tax=Tianweitania aestuarii TaxID=2814886 RepID=A0ABS5RTU5_9HYPH|nr:DUF429 domain-containing protein [Tianweitania aestuarii]MBS9720230.1 DUF429 domain-containing protein [Tianweitania aestuarii]